VVGIIVVWKKMKNEQDTKPEGVYYTTIDETTLQRSPTNKAEPVYTEMNDGEDSKEPQYIDISKNTKQTGKITMQDNPAYSEYQTKVQGNPVYSIPIENQVKIQDNPSYSDECQVKMQDNPAYSISKQANQNYN